MISECQVVHLPCALGHLRKLSTDPHYADNFVTWYIHIEIKYVNLIHLFERERFHTGPEMVPEARRSPGLMLHPVTLWCASCCFMVQ